MPDGAAGEPRPGVVDSAACALGLRMWPLFVGVVRGSWVHVEDDVAVFDSGTDIAGFNAVAAPAPNADPGTVGRLATTAAPT